MRDSVVVYAGRTALSMLNSAYVDLPKASATCVRFAELESQVSRIDVYGFNPPDELLRLGAGNAAAQARQAAFAA